MYLHATMFALPSKLILLYGFCIEPVSYMYLVSLVTVMCSSSFLCNILRQGRKKRFRLWKAGIPIFLHGRDSALDPTI